MAADYPRQAVVIVHGMGEQRPLDTLNGFIEAGLPEYTGPKPYYSRPDKVTNSFESRRYLAPRRPPWPEQPEINAQTEYYEYHWAHLMQGNRIDDLWPVFTRMLLSSPRTVPSGLRFVWALFWLLIVAGAALIVWGPVDIGNLDAASVLAVVVGTGLWGTALTYVVTQWVPGWVQTSFVDVVRYLDTSPRSYKQRRKIRRGMVRLLRDLHDAGYHRIVVVAHSLGAYIAYDGITSLWAEMNKAHGGGGDSANPTSPDGLAEVEEAASVLVPGRTWPSAYTRPTRAQVESYHAAQRKLWLGLRAQGNPWKITDFISIGTPMYMADRLLTSNRDQFDERVGMWELPVCPPRDDGDRKKNDVNGHDRYYSWNNDGVRVLYHGAPFAVVRWTNLWYPPKLGFFGDWFGGEMGQLFGPGIRDVKLEKNGWKSRIPGGAHSLYFKLSHEDDAHPPPTDGDGTARQELRRALDLASSSWLQPTLGSDA